MNFERRIEIQENAEKLLIKLNLYSAPVDLHSILDFHDISCQYEELDDDVSGFLILEKGDATIVVNDLHHTNRQRFTLAHELGHFMLHTTDKDEVFIDKRFQVYNRDNNSSLGIDEREIEANVYAASLLMPEGLVRSELRNFDLIDDADTYILAKKFGVSLQALGFRLAKLGYEVGQFF